MCSIGTHRRVRLHIAKAILYAQPIIHVSLDDNPHALHILHRTEPCDTRENERQPRGGWARVRHSTGSGTALHMRSRGRDRGRECDPAAGHDITALRMRRGARALRYCTVSIVCCSSSSPSFLITSTLRDKQHMLTVSARRSCLWEPPIASARKTGETRTISGEFST